MSTIGLRSLACAVAFMTASAMSGSAEARRIAFDDPDPFTPCTIGVACASGFQLPLNLGYGPAPTPIYVYDNGLVSIGQELPGPIGTVTSLGALGDGVFTPAYRTGGSYAGFFALQSDPSSSSQSLMVNYQLDGQLIQFFIGTRFGDPEGVFSLEFGHGLGDEFEGNPVVVRGDLLDDTLIGYNLFDNLVETTAGQSRSLVLSPDGFIYSFATVPEPSTWMFLILGFGGAGAMMRRRRGLSPA